jgi:tol-pal system protein YbgF
MKPWRHCVRVLCVVLPLSLLASAAWAQSDPRELQNRIDRLERDLSIMQRQVGRPGAPAPGAAAGGEGASSAALVQMEARLSALESSFRDLTGRIEEIAFRLGQFDKRMDKQSGDVDFRLKTLEEARGGAAGQTPPAQPGRPQAAEAKPQGEQGTVIIPTPPPAQAGGPKVAAVQPGRAVSLPSGSPEEQFRYAFEFLNKNDYPQAEKTLRAFTESHPAHPLSGNAYFWLGQISFVGKDYAKSAIDFASSYQKFPDGPKAPDSLIKLGISLANLGKRDDACAAYKQFGTQYPAAAAALKQSAAAESGRLGCR